MSQIKEDDVMKENPYLLFYVLDKAPFDFPAEIGFSRDIDVGTHKIFEVSKDDIVETKKKLSVAVEHVDLNEFDKKRRKLDGEKNEKSSNSKTSFSEVAGKLLNSQFGANNVDKWDVVSEKEKKKIEERRNAINMELRPKKRKRDEFEESFDKGKLPRTRENDSREKENERKNYSRDFDRKHQSELKHKGKFLRGKDGKTKLKN